MSGPVDVLAVMDEAAASQAISSDRADMREARRAVAELIDAGNALMAYRVGAYPIRGDLRDNDASRAQIDALATALANVGGAA